MKKLTLIVLVIIMLFLLESVCRAENEDNITWRLEGGVLTVSGEGEMTSSPWGKGEMR